MDVIRIFDNNSLGFYYKFLVKYEKKYIIRFDEDEEKIIEFISKKLASGKTEKSAVEIEWILDVPVRDDIYEYIINA